MFLIHIFSEVGPGCLIDNNASTIYSMSWDAMNDITGMDK